MKKRLTPPQLAALGLAAVCMALTLVIAISYANYRRTNGPVLAENARLEGELYAAQDRAEDSQAELDRLTEQLGTYEERTRDIRDAVGQYSIFFSDAGPSREEYIQDRMVELLDRRQAVISSVRGQMAAGLNSFSTAFSGQEYVAPEPINVMKEFLKDSISDLAGSLDSTVADVAGDVALAGLDGEDLKSAALESIGGKISGTVRDKAAETLGISGLVSGAEQAGSALSALKSVFDNTPDYALSLTLSQALQYARQVAAVLDNPSAGTEDLRQAVYSYNQFTGYYQAARNLRDEYSLSDIEEASLYGELAQVDAIDRALGVYTILLQKEGAA